jgi:hypothetical protein
MSSWEYQAYCMHPGVDLYEVNLQTLLARVRLPDFTRGLRRGWLSELQPCW